MIRTLIVDDEPLARERLRTLLQHESDIQIVGECVDGRQAVTTIASEAPDLVFLDIQMPALDGFGVLQTLEDRPLPAVIFVTAYDQYALRAFDVHALDYLLKPFTARRFQKALQRARGELQREGGQSGIERRLMNLLEDLGGEKRHPKRLVVKSSGRVYFLKVDEIDWIEAEGNYVRLHVGANSHLLRETMKGMEASLDPDRFIRIHRSTIVNTERIRELQPLFHGEYAVILTDSTRLVASRGPENRLRKMLETAAVR
jgi:two-component system, LytTR family, response regulator